MATLRDFNEYTRIEWNYTQPIYYDCYELSGLMKYMKGHYNARAIFGNFEVAFEENTGRKIVRWTVYLGNSSDEIERWGKETWIGCHESSNGEFLDDLAMLKAGEVTYY